MKNKSFIKVVLLVSLAFIQTTSTCWATAKIDPSLGDFVRQNSVYQKVRIEAIMQPQVIESAPRKYDHGGVVGYLRRMTRASWNVVAQYLDQIHADTYNIKIVRLYAVSAAFTADVTAKGLMQLAQAPNVTKIYANRQVEKVRPVRGKRSTPSTGQPSHLAGQAPTTPYDYVETGLDQLIEQMPNINGSGVVLGHIDTGADGNHPMLQGKILKFYDAKAKKFVAPYDSDEHGTHTAGTMVGGDWNGERIGMAPGAKLICAGPLEDFDITLEGMEFMLNPDSDPNTKDAPRAISNSWNSKGAPDQELFYRAITAWEAAGILPVFSAGNAGPSPSSITNPHEHPLAFAVGATGKNGLVTSFSSRGPGNYQGTTTQKPDIMAPGESIRSSIPGGGFAEMDGTSMATPHVSGMTALLFQANPALTPEQVRAILYKTVTPIDEKGKPGVLGEWNANYGFGKLNIFKAVQVAMQSAKRGMNLSLMPGALSIFSSPEDWTADEINSMQPATFEDAYSYPAEMEGTTWLSAEKLAAEMRR